jgi:hypothetical protein
MAVDYVEKAVCADRLAPVIRMAGQYRRRPIKLFQQQDPHDLVRPGRRPER